MEPGISIRNTIALMRRRKKNLLMPNIEYMYSIYNSKDDRLIALDVSREEALEIMHMKKSTLAYMMSFKNGKNGTWTITRETVNKIEEQINDGIKENFLRVRW